MGTELQRLERPVERFDWLGAKGEMADRIRAHDWARTSVGEPATWPQSLKTALAICLDSRFPMFVWWGKEFTEFYNDAYAVVAGPDKHPHFLGRSGREMWAEIWDVVGPIAEHVLRTGNGTWSENLPLFIRRRGFLEETYFTFSYSAARDDTGEINGIFCACQETTERVLAERRLKALGSLATQEPKSEEEAARHAVEALAGNPEDTPFSLIYVLSTDGRSLRLAASSGIEAGLAGAPHVLLLGEGSVAPWPADLALQTREGISLHDLRKRQGACLPQSPWPEKPDSAFLIPLSRTRTGDPIGLMIAGLSPRLEFSEAYRSFLELAAEQISTRITNVRLRLEAENARERLHRLIMEAPVGICVTEGPEHVFTLVNPTFYSVLFGKDRALVGTTVREGLPEVAGQGFYELLDHVYRTGESFAGTEFPIRLTQADGSEKNLYVTFVYQAKRDPRGEIDGILAVCYDVTEQVLSRQRTEKALRMRDEFLSIASHELKTPLTSLQLQTQMAQRSIARDERNAFNPAGVKKLISQTEKSVQRLTRLVDDMLDISRISTGKLTSQQEPCDLGELVREIVDRTLPQAQAAGATLEILESESVVGNWDRFRIEQVITNFLTNAIRYGAGSPIEVRVRRNGEHARVSVRDHGPGIAPEHHGRIFQRFERAAPASQISGLGLGLFICKEIIERHGGQIRVESEPGKGAAFWFELPLRPAP